MEIFCRTVTRGISTRGFGQNIAPPLQRQHIGSEGYSSTDADLPVSSLESSDCSTSDFFNTIQTKLPSTFSVLESTLHLIVDNPAEVQIDYRSLPDTGLTAQAVLSDSPSDSASASSPRARGTVRKIRL